MQYFPQLCPLALHNRSSSADCGKTTTRPVSPCSTADHSLNVIFNTDKENKNNNDSDYLPSSLPLA